MPVTIDVRARVGIDTGGTFTDLVRVTATRLDVHTVRPTPARPHVQRIEESGHLDTGNGTPGVRTPGIRTPGVLHT